MLILALLTSSILLGYFVMIKSFCCAICQFFWDRNTTHTPLRFLDRALPWPVSGVCLVISNLYDDNICAVKHLTHQTPRYSSTLWQTLFISSHVSAQTPTSYISSQRFEGNFDHVRLCKSSAPFDFDTQYPFQRSPRTCVRTSVVMTFG